MKQKAKQSCKKGG